MAHVAPALIKLAQLAVGSSLEFRLNVRDNQIAQEFCQSVIKDTFRAIGIAVACHLVQRGWVGEVAHLVVLEV